MFFVRRKRNPTTQLFEQLQLLTGQHELKSIYL